MHWTMVATAADGRLQALPPNGEGGQSSACSTLSSPDAIGDAVSQGVHGLGALLECDSIVLRLRTGDTRLASFLCREDVMGALVHAALCTDERRAADVEDDSRERAIRRALVACEILCCEQPCVVSAIQSQPDAVLVPFWALCGGPALQSAAGPANAEASSDLQTRDIISESGQMDAVSSACWARLLHMAAMRVPAAAGRVLVHGAPAAHRAAAILARAEDSPPVVEGVVRLFAAVGAASDVSASDELFAWLREGDMLGLILAADSLCSEADHMLGVLVGHAYPASFPVHRMLAAVTDALCKALPVLLESAADDMGPCPRLSALSDVLERIAISAASVDDSQGSAGSASGSLGGFFGSPARGFVSYAERHNEALALAAHAASAIRPALPAISAALSVPFSESTAYGASCLGMVRLRAAQIAAVAVALAAQDASLAEAICAQNLPARLVALCFAFPNHSLLHCATEDFIRRVCALTGAVSDTLILAPNGTVRRGSSPMQPSASGQGFSAECISAALSMLENAIGLGRLTERIVLLFAAEFNEDGSAGSGDKAGHGPAGALAVASGASRLRLSIHGHATRITSHLISTEALLTDSEHGQSSLGKSCLIYMSTRAWMEYLAGEYTCANVRASYVLGGAQNDPSSLRSDAASDGFEDEGDVEPSADEELARFFCQQVLSSLPDRFRVGLDSDGDSLAARFLSPRLHSAEDDFDDEEAAAESDSSSDSDGDVIGGEGRHFLFDCEGCAVHVDADGHPIPGIVIPLPGMFSSELSFDNRSDENSDGDSLGDSPDSLE